MKKFILVILIILIFIFTISSTKNMIAKSVLTNSIKGLTGLRVDIKKLDLGIFTTLIDVKGLKIYNPTDYQDELMIDIPEIYIDYDLLLLLKGRIHLTELRLNFKELVAIKNKESQLNLNSLKITKEKKKEEKPPAGKKESRFQIDLLRLKVGKVVYKDYSKGMPPQVKTYNINIDKEYRNISNPKKIVKLILYRAVVGTAIADLTEFDIKALSKGLSGTIDKAAKTIEEGTKKIIESGGKLTEEELKKAAEKVKKALKDILPMNEKE